MDVPWYLYVGFIAFVLAMLLVDLKFFDAHNEETRTRQAAMWVTAWVSMAIGFGVIVFFWHGGQKAAEYFAGYLIEYSLSVDNMFVFVVIFSYFSIQIQYQHEVLFYGILGALISRGVFIALGTALVQNFEWVLYIFGAFLIYTAVKIARGGTEDIHPEDNPVLKFFQKHFPTTTRFDGDNFFTIENGKRVATPLFVTLVFIESTDILFAVDSIPAVFGVTRDPFIVLTSNIFAILGLRSLYFLLAGAMERFHLLRYGLGVILGFVGAKMLLEFFHIEVPIWLSLLVIVATLAVTVVLSLKIPPPKRGKEPEMEVAAAEGQGDGAREATSGAPSRASASDDASPAGARARGRRDQS